MEEKECDRSKGDALAAKMAAPWDKFETDGLAKMKALANHDVYRLTPEQLGEWRKTVDPLRKQWADEATKKGVNTDEAFKELDALIVKSGAR